MKHTEMPTLDGKLSPFTRLQRRETIIAKNKPPARPSTKVNNGAGRWIEQSTGKAVIYCGHCHAPVVDSVEARLRHGQMRGDACAHALYAQRMGVLG